MVGNKKIQLITVIGLIALVIFMFEIPNIQQLIKPKATSSYITAQVILTNGQVVNLSSLPKIPSLKVLNPSNGGTVSSINTNLYLTPTFTLALGTTISSYTITGNLQVEIISDSSGGGLTNGEVVYNSGVIPISPVNPLPTLTSGSSSIVASSTVSTSGQPFTTTYLKSGYMYSLEDICSRITLTINFSDNSSASQIAPNASINWEFEYIS
jgi:hypothetical protein